MPLLKTIGVAVAKLSFDSSMANVCSDEAKTVKLKIVIKKIVT